MLKFIPMLLSIFSRAKVLQGAVSSKTTKDQWSAVIAVTVAVAALQAFIPMDSALAEAVTITGIAIATPLILRLMKFKDKGESDTKDDPWAGRKKLTTPLVKVRKYEADSWRDFKGTIADAIATGMVDEGCAEDGVIWDLHEPMTSGFIELPKPADPPIPAKVKKETYNSILAGMQAARDKRGLMVEDAATAANDLDEARQNAVDWVQMAGCGRVYINKPATLAQAKADGWDMARTKDGVQHDLREGRG